MKRDPASSYMRTKRCDSDEEAVGYIADRNNSSSGEIVMESFVLSDDFDPVTNQ